MNYTNHSLDREVQRNGNLDMSYRKTEYYPNPRYPGQYYQVEYYSNGTRVLPVDAKTNTVITTMTNVNGSSLDGVSIGLRNYYNYPSTYDKNPKEPPAPARHP